MGNHAILGTDFSKAVSKIIEKSEMFKEIGIEKITLIHVLNLRELIMVEQFTIEGLEQKLEKQRQTLTEKGFEVSAELIYGIPFIELERKRKETGADIIIVGSHGRTSASSTIGGTIADVLQNMKAPVLVVPLKKSKTEGEEFPGRNIFEYEQIMMQLEKMEPDWDMKCDQMTNHILLPTDFSDFSENAFQWVKKLKTHLPKVTMLHVQDEVKIGAHLSSKLEEFNMIDSARLARLKNAFMIAHPDTEVKFELIYGKPTQAILNYIKDNNVTLTVLGSQGKGFFSEIFIGSVSHQVARNANSNVLIVPISKE